MKPPSDPGMVVVPPDTGTTPDSVVVPHKEIDPAITKPTDEIDKKNRKKSQNKPRAQDSAVRHSQ